MLTNATHLKGPEIWATDGEIGTVDQFYFDDESWAIRYLVVQTGDWLGGRQGLISPFSAVQTDWQARRLDVALTKKQVENSPGIDTHQPVSRQHEAEYNRYYGHPYYWGRPLLWGPALNPGGLTIPATAYPEATDGEIGHLDGFVIDDDAWPRSNLESTPVTREYETRLYVHYGRPPYWIHDAKRDSLLSLSGV
jgi:hypothetical protein